MRSPSPLSRRKGQPGVEPPKLLEKLEKQTFLRNLDPRFFSKVDIERNREREREKGREGEKGRRTVSWLLGLTLFFCFVGLLVIPVRPALPTLSWQMVVGGGCWVWR